MKTGAAGVRVVRDRKRAFRAVKRSWIGGWKIHLIEIQWSFFVCPPRNPRFHSEKPGKVAPGAQDLATLARVLAGFTQVLGGFARSVQGQDGVWPAQNATP